MPDLPKRKKAENALALLLAPELERQTRAMLSAGLKPIGPLAWLKMRTSMAAAMETQLKRNYQLAAILMLTSPEVPISVEDIGGYVGAQRLDTAAVTYAQQRSLAVADLVTASIRRRYEDILRDVEAAAVEAEAAAEKIAEIATKARAERIAVNETTAATTAGEMGVAELSRANGGPVIRPIVNTEDDDRVCEICWPLHRIWLGDVPLAYQAGPPFHGMCRCYLTWERVEAPVQVQMTLGV